MKKLFFITLAAITFQFACAQEKEENPFKRFYINAGVYSADSPHLASTIAYTAGLEYKFKDETSIGVNLFYMQYDKFLGNPSDKGINFTFNYDWSEKLGLNTSKFDLYTGVNFGITNGKRYYPTYNNAFQSNELTSVTKTDIGLGGQIGLRYFLTKNIGLNAEINQINGISGIKLGTTIRF